MQQKKSILPVITLAIFSFCFLCTEYMFDDMMALVAGSTEVVNAQNLVLGASVAGFVLYAFLHKYLSKKTERILVCAAMFVNIGCVFVIMGHCSRLVIYAGGIVCFVIMGVAGSAVCYFASRAVENYASLGKLVGIAYALGIFIQYCNNNWVRGERLEAIVISCFMLAFVGCIFKLADNCDNMTQNLNQDIIKIKSPAILLTALCLCVFLMTLIFSTLDNAVTLVHSAGEFNIGQWPRLLLAVSSIVAGCVYDLKNRRFMPLIMYVITMLSVISIVVIKLGGSFVFGLIVFYISAGFFVVFFMVSFMDISYYTKMPRLWAGMGRAVNNLCAIVSTAFTVSLLNSGSIMAILIVAIVLLACITCAIIVYYVPFVTAIRDNERESVKEEALKEYETKAKSNSFELFVEEHSFTEREAEIMNELLTNNDSVSSISRKLALSRASLYRHIDKMNEKTNTSSRTELIHYYHNWTKMKY